MKTFSLFTLLALCSIAISACHPTSSQKSSEEGISGNTLTLGPVTVTAIQDNAKPRVMPRTLFPDASDSLFTVLNLSEGVPASISVFWAQTDTCSILFDTGNGLPDSQLLPCLEAQGVSPKEVEYIYLTHFHGDHIGGLMRGDTVVFPNAQIYASQKEYEAWLQMAGKNNLVVKTMNAYQDRLHLFAFNDTLPGGVIAMEAIGHTPGHTAYRMGDFLIVGDIMHGVDLQLHHPEICATYDMDKDAAINARRYYIDYARTHHLTMAGMHFPVPGFK